MRNVRLAYFLSFAFHGWFWLGNWIFYYLSFGNYATVAMLDSVAMLAGLIYEIPTGAFADLIGKKKTLMIAFFLQMLGNFLMGTAKNVWMLALPLWFLVALGYSFYSGTMDALVYDSLVDEGKEAEFDKKIGSVGAMRLIAMAICAVIGGVVYKYSAGLPFILNGLLGLFGFGITFFLTEPKTDTEKYSIKTFFIQNTKGIKELVKNVRMQRISLFLAVTGSMLVLVYNLLDDLLAVEYGFVPQTISWLFATACLVAGVFAYIVPRLKWNLDVYTTLVVSSLVMGVGIAVSPIVTAGMFAGILLIRVIGEVIYQNYTSVVINANIESKVRATTLSSLSLIRNIPYSILGTFLGGAVAVAGGARQFSLYYGLLIIVLALILGGVMKLKAD